MADYSELSFAELARRLGRRSGLFLENAELLEELARRLDERLHHGLGPVLRRMARDDRERARNQAELGRAVADAECSERDR